MHFKQGPRMSSIQGTCSLHGPGTCPDHASAESKSPELRLLQWDPIIYVSWEFKQEQQSMYISITYIYEYIHVCLYVYIYTCLYACLCMHACMHVMVCKVKYNVT